MRLTPWQSFALSSVARRPGVALPTRGALVTGARGLVRLGLAEQIGVEATSFRLTPEGRAELARSENAQDAA